MNNKTITLKTIQKNLGYTFKNINLLKKALNTSSNPARHQFMEHRGDAYLSHVIRDWGTKEFKPENADEYFSFTSKACSNIILALVAENIGISSYINKNNSEVAVLNEALEKEHADIMEALFDSIKKDGGMRAVKKVILHIIPLQKIRNITIAPLNSSNVKKNSKDAVKNWIKTNSTHTPPVYKSKRMGGMWICTLTVHNKTLKATGQTSKEAEQFAALWMLNFLEQKRLRKILF